MGINDGSRVAAAKPKVGGGVYWAPLGTALPTDSTTALNAAFKCLGAISDDGVKPSRETNIEKEKEWDGSTLATLLTDESRTFSFTLKSVHDKDVLEFVFSPENVTVTAAAGAVGTKLAVTDKGGKPEKGVLVLEMTHGGIKQRKVVPVADPTITEEGDYVKGALRSYTAEVEALKDSAGTFSYEYTELDDAPA